MSDIYQEAYLDLITVNTCSQMNLDFEKFIPTKYVMIYGFDYVGKFFYEMLKRNGNKEVVCFCDPTPSEEQYDGLPVYPLSPDDLLKIDEPEASIIVTLSPYYRSPQKEAGILLLREIISEAFWNHSFSPEEEREFNIGKIKSLLFEGNNPFSNICLTGTPYGLLLYLLYIKDPVNTFYFVEGLYPLKDAADTLRSYGAPCLMMTYNEHVPYESVFANNAFATICREHREIPFYGQDTVPSIPQMAGKNFVMYEDGKTSYIGRDKLSTTKGYHVYTFEPDIEKIIFAGLLEVPEEIRYKAEMIDIEKLWNDKSNEEKDLILNVFGFNYSGLNDILSSGRNTILFTQGFSNAQKATEENQIALYRDILSHYDPKKIIIKPHPNDVVNYSEIFKECVVLPAKLPAELLKLCKLPVERVVGADEGSNVFGFFNNVSVDLYSDLLPKHSVESFIL